jgi:hypothetical protein
MSYRPTIVCLCGSTKSWQEFQRQNVKATLAGKIVLSIAPFENHDDVTFSHLSETERQQLTDKLDTLHKYKIDLADEILIINVGGYIGESTKRELEYARAQNKTIRFLENNCHFFGNNL